MKPTRPLVIIISLLLSVQTARAQDLSRYRDYVLESSVGSVIAANGVRTADAKTLHERPATIQELQWRAPYSSSAAPLADPVRGIAFTFYNDALYQMIVNYDRVRTEGLTNKDVLDTLSATYGVPVLASATTRTSPPAGTFPDSVVLARWESEDSVVTLLRGSYASEFQLVLVSKQLSTRARSAILEAVRLDAIEAPQREAKQRDKESGDANAARDKTRTTNKAAFRP